MRLQQANVLIKQRQDGSRDDAAQHGRRSRGSRSRNKKLVAQIAGKSEEVTAAFCSCGMALFWTDWNAPSGAGSLPIGVSLYLRHRTGRGLPARRHDGPAGPATLLMLVPELSVRHGEPWRLVSFLFYLPPNTNFVFIFQPSPGGCSTLMGNALEAYWGVFRYNLFPAASATALTVGSWPSLQPGHGLIVSNEFSGRLGVSSPSPTSTRSLSYHALLHPPGEDPLAHGAVRLGASYAAFFRDGLVGSGTRLQIVAAVGNFASSSCRPGPLAERGARPAAPGAGGGARRAHAAEQDRAAPSPAPDLRQDRSDGPAARFSLLLQVRGATQCYCPDHIFNHEHVRSEDGGATES